MSSLPQECISSDSPSTGHRDPDPEQVDCLKAKFLDGEFGRTIACGVQLLDSEDNGRKLIDDGLSTVLALKAIKEGAFKTDSIKRPDGQPWGPMLTEIFNAGLPVRVVAYPDDGDRDARQAWNIAKHDREQVSVAWSTVYSKVAAARHSGRAFPRPA